MPDNTNKPDKNIDKGKMGQGGQGQQQGDFGKKGQGQQDIGDQKSGQSGGRKPGEMDAPNVQPNVKKDFE